MTLPTTADLSLVALATGMASAVVGNGEVKKGPLDLPQELVICPWGESRDLDGEPVIVNEVTLAQLAANQTRYGFDEVALDFEHNTVPKRDEKGKALPIQEPAPIAGMGTLSVREGVGIVYQPVSWTTEGEPAFRGRHFRDLSPTVSKNEKGEVIFVHSVALCRNGQIRDLHAFSATLKTLSQTTLMDTPNYRDLLRTKLNLPEDATDEQLIAGLETLSAVKVEEQKPEPTPMSAAAVPGDLTALAARQDDLEKQMLITQATGAGKVIPLSADALKATPLSVVRELVANAPAGVVPMAAGVPAKEVPAVKALSAEEKVVAARFGYSEEKWREMNP